VSAVDRERRSGPALWYGTVTLVVGLGAYLVRHFEWDVVWQSRDFLLMGLLRSWLFAVSSIVLGMLAGIALGAARRHGGPLLRWPATLYIELVRATPQLMVILWVFFIVPEVTGLALSPELSALVALSIIASAYLAEVVRAGLGSVSRLQAESGYATGLGSTAIFLNIVLPQALRNMVPALIATFVMLFKTTTLIYVLGVIDLFNAGNLVNTRAVAPYAIYTTMAVVYFLCCYALSAFVRWLDPKYTLTS
jgi:polar amino acid transport system permease protein